MGILLRKKYYSYFPFYSLWVRLFTIELEMSQKKCNFTVFENFKPQPGNQMEALYKAIQLL